MRSRKFSSLSTLAFDSDDRASIIVRVRLLRNLLIASLLLISVNSSTVAAASPEEEKQKQQKIAVMISAFYTGCISGIVAVMETGYYVNEKDDKELAFKRMQNKCKEHTIYYSIFLGYKESK